MAAFVLSIVLVGSIFAALPSRFDARKKCIEDLVVVLSGVCPPSVCTSTSTGGVVAIAVFVIHCDKAGNLVDFSRRNCERTAVNIPLCLAIWIPVHYGLGKLGAVGSTSQTKVTRAVSDELQGMTFVTLSGRDS